MGIEMERIPAQPTSPAGMVLISKSNQQHWIWPVHLSGWLAQGWQLNQPTVGSADPPTAGHIPVPAVQPETDATPASSAAAKRRGRKAKSVDAAAVTEPAQDPFAAENEPSVEAVVDPQDPTPGEELGSAGSNPAVDGATAPDAGGGFALPDDLLNAEF